MSDDFYEPVGSEPSNYVITQCAYPGCEKTVRHTFLDPPPGWACTITDDDKPILFYVVVGVVHHRNPVLPPRS
jgi:hypothetical protein